MSIQPTLTEIFMSKARERVAYYRDVSKAINEAENAVDGSDWLRKYKTVEQDINTWESVSGLVTKLLSEQDRKSTYLETYNAYLSHAKKIIEGADENGFKDALRQFQVDENCRKLDLNATNSGFDVVLRHLEDNRGGEIAEKDLKSAFRALDRQIRKAPQDQCFISQNRDAIVREIRDIAIASRREFKAQVPAARAA